MLPKSIAQLTGIMVCSIVVFGTDMDVSYAMPLGILCRRAGDVLRLAWRKARARAARR